MAKAVVLKSINRVTWNLKTIPSNVDVLLQRIQNVNAKDVINEVDGDGVAIINNTGLDKITAYVSFVNNIIDCYVVTPSGVFHQFTVDVTSNNYDVDWWSFALRNYHIVVATSDVKKALADLIPLDVKEITGSIVFKGKSNSHKSSMSLQDLFDEVCPA